MMLSLLSAALQSPVSVVPLFINLGVPELSIIVVLVLILFGPGKLPSVMKTLGDGVRQFKDATNGKGSDSAATTQPQQQSAPQSIEQTYQPSVSSATINQEQITRKQDA